MKNLITLLVLALVSTVSIYSQPPQAFKYQAVVRDNAGEIRQSQEVGIRMNIHDQTAAGTIVYQETFSETTNDFGLVNLQIRNGTPTIGTFSAIDWGSNSKFLETEIDPTGGTEYISMGTSELLSVPYALYSATSGGTSAWEQNGDTIYYETGIVGIGTTSPQGEFQINDHFIWAGVTFNGTGQNDILVDGTYSGTGETYYIVQVTEVTNDRDFFKWSDNNGATWEENVEMDHSDIDLSYGISIGFEDLDGHTVGDQWLWMMSENSKVFIVKNGMVGIGTIYPGATLDVAGHIWQTETGNSVFIGVGAGENDDLSYNNNVFIGRNSGNANTTGYYNTACGYYSLKNNTSGHSNTTSGSFSLYQNTSGNYNTANGDYSLSHNTTGDFNTASGGSSLYSNTTANKNTAHGYHSLYSNTTGEHNTANGFHALRQNTLGNNNTASGSEALYSNTYGSYNSAFGDKSLYANTSGFNNTSVGFMSLYSNVSSSHNSSLGYKSLYSNTAGEDNTAVGSKALFSNTSGNENTANGYQSLFSNTSGIGNTSYGFEALYSNTEGDYSTAVGYKALNSNTSGYGNTAIGVSALEDNTTGANNSAIGSHALTHNTTGIQNTAIGSSVLTFNTTGNGNTACGFYSLRLNSTGSKNIAYGGNTLQANTTGERNTAVGSGALYYNTTASYNTAIGYRTLFLNTTGGENTATGYFALANNSTGYGNTATGFEALKRNTSGYNNTANGRYNLYHTTTGDRNTALGYYAMYNNTTGHKNVALGAYAGDLLAGNAYCTFVGYASDNNTDYPRTNSTAIGNQTVITSSNQVRVGNSSVTSIGGYENWTNVSDKRFKKNIKKDVPGLGFILKLQPVTYKLDVDKLDSFLGIPDSLRNDEKLKQGAIEKAAMIQTGFIAQDVEDAAQSLGYDFSGVDAPKNDASLYGLRYAEFVVPLVKAVQQQQAIIEELKLRIEELERGK